jgi:hypothetical protein
LPASTWRNPTGLYTRTVSQSHLRLTTPTTKLRGESHVNRSSCRRPHPPSPQPAPPPLSSPTHSAATFKADSTAAATANECRSLIPTPHTDSPTGASPCG